MVLLEFPVFKFTNRLLCRQHDSTQLNSTRLTSQPDQLLTNRRQLTLLILIPFQWACKLVQYTIDIYNIHISYRSARKMLYLYSLYLFTFLLTNVSLYHFLYKCINISASLWARFSFIYLAPCLYIKIFSSLQFFLTLLLPAFLKPAHFVLDYNFRKREREGERKREKKYLIPDRRKQTTYLKQQCAGFASWILSF